MIPRLKSIGELHRLQRELAGRPRPETEIRVCSTGCRALGALSVCEALEQEISTRGLGKRVRVVRTGCLGLCAGAGLCPLLALALGPVLLRLKGHYFAMATLGLNEAVKQVVSNSFSVTGGGMGISLPLPPWRPADNAMFFYYLLLGTMLLSVWITWEFSRRRIGLTCCAIRDNETKAEAMGLYTTRCKTAAWAISAFLTGLVGSINAYWITYIDPPAVFDMAIAVKSFVIFLLGGPATVFGPVIAAFFIELLATLTWSKLLNWHVGALGLIIMLVVLLFPAGFRPAWRRIQLTLR